MRNKIFAFLTVFFLLGSGVSAEARPKAHKIVEKLEGVLRGKSHDMTISMKVKTPSWERSYKLRVWMKGEDFAFARVLEPAKIRNQAFLRIKGRLWNYLPSAEKTILIPPSLMHDEFLGSDFSNDDLIKMSYLPRDYNAVILGRELIGKDEYYHLELKPKPEAPVTYGKLKITLRKKDAMPTRMDFFNERLELIRSLHYSEPKKFRGHRLPSVWRMENVENRGRETVITVEDARFNKRIKGSVFTHENLENQEEED